MTMETPGRSDQQRDRWYKHHPRWAWTAGIVGTAAFVVLLIWGPWWIEGHHLRDDKGQLVSSAGIIVTGFRTMLIAIVAGAVAAAGLWYTHKSHQQTEKLFEHTRAKDREQAELTREGQVTDRYVDAIKLLASDKLHERLGGIYSLERIMQDSEKDRGTVTEVLAAFVRDKLPPSGADGEGTQRGLDPEVRGLKEDHTSPLDADVRSAINVLGRNWEGGRARADLRTINGASLNMAELDLRGAQLQRAYLAMANLSDANLSRAQLSRANLDATKLSHTNLAAAHLKWARLSHARMHHVDLTGANLRGALLSGARMRQVALEGVDLADAYLKGAVLDEVSGLTADVLCRARIYQSTKLPTHLAQDPKVQARIAHCEALQRSLEAVGPPPPVPDGNSTPGQPADPPSRPRS
ncbi:MULTISPECIES: pentapeptide repeat-containing protein [unclassified Streptomyces]|uniref:pentapeptide repeat-containing protein n=1 Tax=unclassified Streptomyces TaxID=2593676 RepID=UPI00131BCA0B|nr:pentapeptide repeat-containing protein [Streptomyces sp. CB01635]